MDTLILNLTKAMLEGTQTMEYYFDLGEAYHQMYLQSHKEEALQSAIQYYKSGLEVDSVDHEVYHEPLLNNLAIALSTKYEQLGEMKYLEEAIICHKQALSLCPPGHPYRPRSLNNLGLALNTRYEELGKMKDLEEAIACHEQMLDLYPYGHPDRPGPLNNLANALSSKYNQLGVMDDLERVISCHEEALKVHQLGHPKRSMSLNNLAAALYTKYKQSGKMKDLEKVIAYNEQALDLHPPGHPDRSASLNNLALALDTRYEQLGEMKDLEKAITCHEEALNLCPPGHSRRSTCLSSLGLALYVKYQQLGNMKDLEKAKTCHEQALNKCPTGHPDQSSCLNNLGNTLYTTYEQLGKIEDLEMSITCHKQALNLRPLSHPQQSSSLNNLASALSARYQKLGKMGDLEEAITFARLAVKLRPHGHPKRPSSLTNLAGFLSTRYDQLGEVKDLDAAITCDEEALNFHPPGHPDRSATLNNLASAKWNRFKELGEMNDLEKAIICYEQALKWRQTGHSLRSSSLYGLGNALETRYGVLGEMKDLEQAIAYHEQALELCPPGNPLRSMSLNGFANVLSSRIEVLGEMKDLKKILTLYEEALELCPHGNPDRSRALNNLGGAWWTMYIQSKKNVDLEKAIAFYEQACKLRPPGHPNRPSSLQNVAIGFSARYKQLGEMEDLQKAIELDKQALNVHPPGHPGRPKSLVSLAGDLALRYTQLGNTEDLDEATSGYKAALSYLSPHHPFYSSVLFGQASLLITAHNSAWVSCHTCSHIDKACLLFEAAAHHAASGLHARFRVAKQWASIAHMYKHQSAIGAYSMALDLQQQHLALLPSVISQQILIKNSAQLSLNAASCAISNGRSELAMQFLEQGRSILWSKIQGYRQSFDELSAKDSQLASEFKAVAHQLEHNAVSTEVDITLQHVLSEKWSMLLEKIRKLEGFSNFLQAVPFAELQVAGKEGPIIMVNISEFQSDALILVSSGPPITVALHDASSNTLVQLLKQLWEITSGMRPPKDVVLVLQYLWDIVVHPVVKQLAQLNIRKKSRIWWCPTSYLCGLPLHAAGPYQEGSNNLPYLYTSSYIPTLISLIRARSGIIKLQAIPKMLVISQADSIPKVTEEVEVVKQFRKDGSFVSGQDAQKKAILATLQSHSWVHFACHGHVEDQPFESWFQLHNGEHLSILDLAKARLPNAEFAFLSACHSAAGDIYGTPDESIHLAAALQFCGFKSVIGTLWAMADVDGPVLAHAFYSHMFHKGQNVDFRDAAEALNLATRKLKKKGVSLDRRINFIHIGA